MLLCLATVNPNPFSKWRLKRLFNWKYNPLKNLQLWCIYFLKSAFSHFHLHRLIRWGHTRLWSCNETDNFLLLELTFTDQRSAWTKNKNGPNLRFCSCKKIINTLWTAWTIIIYDDSIIVCCVKMSAFPPQTHKQILKLDMTLRVSENNSSRRGEFLSNRINWYEKDNRKYMTA